MPSRMVVARVINTAVSKFLFITRPLYQPYVCNQHVNQLDPEERNDDSAKAIQQQVVAQERGRAQRAVLHAPQRQRDQGHDDQRIENDRREYRRLGRPQMHDVQRIQHREGSRKHGRDDGEVLGHIVGNRKRGQRAARHQQLFADFYYFNQLGGVGIQVHHVAGFLGRLSAGVHGHAYVGLGQGGGVVGAVAGHGYELALALLAANQVHLVLGGGLGQKFIHARLARDRGGGQRIIPGNHDGPDAHGAQLREAITNAAFNDVFELDYAQRAPAFLGYHQGRSAAARNLFDFRVEFPGQEGAVRGQVFGDGVSRSLTNFEAIQVHARHAGLRGKRDKLHVVLSQFASPQPVFFFSQHHNGAAFRCLVGQRRKLRRAGHFLHGDSRGRHESHRLPVPQRDGAGLVQQQRVDIARGLHCPAGHGQNVVLNQTVHAGYANRRQ